MGLWIHWYGAIRQLRPGFSRELTCLWFAKHDLITRCTSNGVAYHQAPNPPRKPRRGRPRKYGQPVLLTNLFRSALAVNRVESPLYDDKNVMLRIRSIDLLWKPASDLVRFVLVEHPTRGRWVLMCTDLTLAPIDIIRLNGLRFKRAAFRIEFCFKQAAHVIGTFDYHFWIAPRRSRRAGRAAQIGPRRSGRAGRAAQVMNISAAGCVLFVKALHPQSVLWLWP